METIYFNSFAKLCLKISILLCALLEYYLGTYLQSQPNCGDLNQLKNQYHVAFRFRGRRLGRSCANTPERFPLVRSFVPLWPHR
jgi:hypothetical protein